VQLAQASKATVYATVSTEAEEYYLSNTFGLPRTQIFSMTNSSFSNEILRATNGQGVDIALSSLSGELQHATWQSISEFGKLVETDTADLAGSRSLDLNASGCRTYARVSLEALVAKKQAIAKE
jgi:NADPH:quinone reductase-like Zn-dependent oxidoreductase